MTLVAIVIGIFSVVVMFSSIYGIKLFVQTSIEDMGWNNSIIIYPSEDHQTVVSSGMRGLGRRRFMYMSRQVKPLDISDYYALKQENNYKYLYGMIENRNWLSLPTERKFVRLKATNLDFFHSKSYTIDQGRFFNNYEEANGAKVAVVGSHFVTNHFSNDEPINKMITIGDLRYKIIGTLKLTPQPPAGMDFDEWTKRMDLEAVYIPLQTGSKYTKQNNAIDFIYIQSEDEDSFSYMKNRTRQILLANHQMGHDFSFQDVGATVAQISQELEEVLKKWNITLTTIASISLLVGGLGLFSTMLISLNERMLEIGIRKSVGATPVSIFFHFILESLLLSLIGALVGILLSVISLKIASQALTFSFPIVYEGILLGIAFAAIIGFLSGFYPAFLASKMDPIQAIYYNE
ncbi:MAG: ABC transporter permease [Candidatus Cloacimonadia bacterium]